MIARLDPAFGWRELAAAARPRDGAVASFESALARQFGCAFGVAFPYGRSGLRALLASEGIRGGEVIMPAYTCSVVAHAVVLSGNTPVFADINPADGNMRLDEVERLLGPATRAVIATHLFGHPLDAATIEAAVAAHEQTIGHRILIVQDCAHAFGASQAGRPVASRRDAALFGLNVSKTISSIFGGMITTNDSGLQQKLAAYRDRTFAAPGFATAAARRAYLAATAAAFRRVPYSGVHWLVHRSHALDRFTRAYHLDHQIRFPPDAARRMTDVEASVGLVQLDRYAEFVEHRRRLAALYTNVLSDLKGVTLPPMTEGATYSHYTVRVGDRARVIRGMARSGVELGCVIDYVVPELPEYAAFTGGRQYPQAAAASREVVNLPIHPRVSDADAHRIAQSFRRVVRTEAA